MDVWESNFGEFYEKIEDLKKEKVILAYDKIGKRLCVVKKYKVDISEILESLKNIQSERLPKIYRIIKRENAIWVIEEYIEGQTLSDILKLNEKGLSEKFAINILKQLCEVLILTHNKKIIHRDIKPANIILTKDNNAKLIDFGIARIIKTESEQDTEIMGTKGYAPPEQYGFKGTNFASDIYSLGITIKRILPKNYSGKLTRILNKCASFDPNMRYQSAKDLLSDLNKEQEKIFAFKLFFSIIIITGIFIVFYFNDYNKEENKPNILIEEEKTEEKTEENTTETIVEEKKEIPNTITQTKLQDNSLAKTENPVKNFQPAEKNPQSNRGQISCYLNGEILSNNVKVIPYNEWQNFPKDDRSRVCFPKNYTLKLQGNDYTSIRITSSKGEENFLMDSPNSDGNAELNISLNKYCFEADLCVIGALFQSENLPPRYKEFTFWLEKKNHALTIE